MIHRVGLIGLIGVAGLSSGTSLLACGDKFLVAGRGARFQRGGAHAQSVLIYTPASSALGGELKNLSVESVLLKAGYRSATVGSAEQLDQALKEKSPDVVLVDVADARTVERHAPPGSSGPTILPVLDKASRQDFAEAKKTWGVALRCPASGDSLLDAVDEAAELHAKAKKNAGPKR